MMPGSVGMLSRPGVDPAVDAASALVIGHLARVAPLGMWGRHPGWCTGTS